MSEPDCDKCYGEKTEDCPENCVTSHIRYVKPDEELQEWMTLKLREILDPVVITAGYSPEDYEIVWKPLVHSSCQKEMPE